MKEAKLYDECQICNLKDIEIEEIFKFGYWEWNCNALWPWWLVRKETAGNFYKEGNYYVLKTSNIKKVPFGCWLVLDKHGEIHVCSNTRDEFVADLDLKNKIYNPIY